ncbi:MAG: hypothetical protein HYT97_06505 [Elusimicrobia bacterium]|nr:hypothetical protein [Elusimicrobiota bacterium]
MKSVSVAKNQYEVLIQKASLYDAFLKSSPESVCGIESYTPMRIKKFLKADQLDKSIAKRLKRIFKS